MWFWLLVIGGLFGTVRTLTIRLIMRDEREGLVYTFIYQTIIALLMLPLVFLSFKSIKLKSSHSIFFLIGVLDSLSVYLFMESARLFEVSIRKILTQIEMVWVLALSALFLNEEVGWWKVLGTVLIFLGIAVASFKKERVSRLKGFWSRLKRQKRGSKEKGVIFIAVATIIKAFEAVIIKQLLEGLTPQLVAFGIRSVSALCLMLIIKNLGVRARKFLKRKSRLVLIHSFAGTAAYFFWLWATAMTEVSKTYPISQAFTMLVIVAGIVFLKERERIWQKILGGILAIIGVILVKGS